ncbi:MAG: hypothetical protein ACLSB9_38195 [Hydrogeniiclostridium mannosilyticum]
MYELIAQHRSSVFDTWLEQDKISARLTMRCLRIPNGIYLDGAERLYRRRRYERDEFKVVGTVGQQCRRGGTGIFQTGLQINVLVHLSTHHAMPQGKILTERLGDHGQR